MQSLRDDRELAGPHRGGRRRTRGRHRRSAPTAPPAHRFPLASVTKPLAAYAALVAYEEGAVELDEPAGPDGLDGPASARAHLGPGLRRAPGDGRARAPAGCTPTPGSRCSATTSPRRPDIPFAEYLRQAVLEPLGMTSTTLDGLARQGRRLDRRRPGAVRGRGAGAAAAGRRVRSLEAMTVVHPGLEGRPAGLRAPEAQRLGARLRDPRRQVPALDGHFVLAAHLRALRPVRHVPVDRPGRGRGVRGADGPGLRAVGGRGVAAVHGRGAGRAARTAA